MEKEYCEATSDYSIDIHHRSWVPPRKTKGEVKRYNMLCRESFIENVRADKRFEKKQAEWFKMMKSTYGKERI